MKARGFIKRLFLSIISLIWLFLGAATAVQVPAEGPAGQGRAKPGGPGAHGNFDARSERRAKANRKANPTPQQLDAIRAVGATVSDLAVTFDEESSATRTLMNRAGYLTDVDPTPDRAEIAHRYMRDNRALLGLREADLAEYETTDLVRDDVTGATHLYVRQTFRGLPVYNGQLQVNVNRNGRILSINNSFVPNLAAAVNRTSPSINRAEAVREAMEQMGTTLNGRPEMLNGETVDRNGISRESLEPRLMLLPIERGAVRLVWNFQIATLDSDHWYDFTVDAETGEVWTRFDWVAADQYKVYELPVESPSHTSPAPPSDGRTTQVNPANATASPFGWHDTNGVAGAEFTIMQGNNAHAYDDVNFNNLPPAVEPSCGVTLDCTFSIDLTQAPSAYTSAVVANLFYWNNIIHDVQYQYGFTSAAGNFQTNTYAMGGLGNDEVQAEAQEGSGVSNANFLTLPDGSRPRMQMYIWTAATPDRDGALDAGVVVHEYGHGISNRLVGGPSNVSCLGNTQAPSEGLSDWWTLWFTARPTDTGPLGRGIATYALGQPTTGPGIRAQLYSTDPAINPWKYSSINGMTIPHGVGSVWAQAMWKAYWALVDAHGFDANRYNAMGNAGNLRANLYVTEGLQNTICSPAFTDVRDGILQAAADNHGGEDVCLLWGAFAAFGLGANAISGGSSSTSPTDGFSIPFSCFPGGAPPTISISDASVFEGNGILGPRAAFTVSLSKPPTLPVTVSYATANGTAMAITPSVTTSNTNPIIIPVAGSVTPYPSVITSAATPPGSVVTKVTAAIFNYSHSWPGDVDLLLQGPGGQTVLLMSDVGEEGQDATSLNITFDDSAPPMPGIPVSGTFRPTNNPGRFGVEPDAFPAPAPAGPYETSLSVFNGLNPLGDWKLYVVDDTTDLAGSITGGWSLSVFTSIGDYQPTSGELTFPAGVTTRTLAVAIRGDLGVEPNETFLVNLSNPTNAILGDDQALGTIVNDDGPTPPPGAGPADLAIDFGASGLWGFYNGAAYGLIHSSNPSLIATGDIDGNGQADLIADFPTFGVWARLNNSSWLQIHTLDVSGIATGDVDGNGKSDVILNFGAFGVWIYLNNASFFQIHTGNPNMITTGDFDGNGRTEVILNFSPGGISRWSLDGGLAFVHGTAATSLAVGNVDGVGGDELVVGFPGFGLYMLKGTTWVYLHSLTPARMVVADIDNHGRGDIVANFTGFGVYVLESLSSWRLVHSMDVGLLTAGDINNNGRADLVMTFAGSGLWVFRDDIIFAQIHPLTPQGVVVGNLD